MNSLLATPRTQTLLTHTYHHQRFSAAQEFVKRDQGCRCMSIEAANKEEKESKEKKE
jgi:hypothetical protein